MKTIKISAIAVAVAVGLAACGGSGSSGSTVAAVETRTFESSWINGVYYSTPTQSGITGKDCITVKPGCFDVLPGEQVTFTIGNLELPPITAAPGQKRITAVEVAKAIDPEQGVQGLPARAIIAYLDALDDGSVDDVDGKRVFQVKPIKPNTASVTLKDLLKDVTTNDELKNELEDALTDAGEASPDVNTDASLETDLAKEEIGYKDGIQPLGFFTDAEVADALPLNVNDLADTIWTAHFQEDGNAVYNSAYFIDGGVIQLAETQNDLPADEALVLDGAWNVVNGVFVINDDPDDITSAKVIESSESSGETEDCIVTAKSETSITLKCREYKETNGSTTNFDESITTLIKVNDLAGVLTANGGKWNMAFEAQFEEEGTITLASNKTFTDTNTETENDVVTTFTGSGSYSVNGLLITLNFEMEDGEAVEYDEAFSCHFAGLSLSEQDIALRCSYSSTDPDESEDSPEDVLLTKRTGVPPLENTSTPEDQT